MSVPDMDKRPPALNLPPPAPSSSKDSVTKNAPKHGNRRKTQGGGDGGGGSNWRPAPNTPAARSNTAAPPPQTNPKTPRNNQSRQVANRERAIEVGSAYRPGPRKGRFFNADDTHYQNKTSKPRTGYPFHNMYRRDNEAFSKEHFLKANCQFVVWEGVDVAAYAGDPDVVVEWSGVEELRIWGGEEVAACPICLHPPTAGKMGKCGHTFCWPCILHYLALSDHSWRKCPICYDPIYTNQLKSYSERKGDPVVVGGTLTMKLMCRLKGSIQALPASLAPGVDVAPPSEEEMERYAKVMGLSDAAIVERILGRERRELEFLVATEAHTPEICFVYQAIAELEKREEAIAMRRLARQPNDSIQAMPKQPVATTVYVDAFYEIDAPKNTEGESTEKTEGESSSDGLPISGEEATASTGTQDKSSAAYFFFQAGDGQAVYLHPVNAKMLVAQYGSLSAAPPSITGKVVESESVVVGERFRSRFRYLAHLPLASSLHLVELALPPDLIGPAVRAQFAGEISRRATARKQRAEEDRRRAEKAAKWDRALLMNQASWSEVATYVSGTGNEPGEIPNVVYVPSAQHQPPPPRPETPPPFDLAADFGSGLSCTGASSPSPPQAPASPPQLHSVPSFAQMLQSGAKSGGKGAWGAAPPRAQAPPPSVVKPAEDEDPALPAPSYQNAFGDAMASALERMALENGATNAPKSGKKKKKTKGTILFST